MLEARRTSKSSVCARKGTVLLECPSHIDFFKSVRTDEVPQSLGSQHILLRDTTHLGDRHWHRHRRRSRHWDQTETRTHDGIAHSSRKSFCPFSNPATSFGSFRDIQHFSSCPEQSRYWHHHQEAHQRPNLRP